MNSGAMFRIPKRQDGTVRHIDDAPVGYPELVQRALPLFSF